MSSVAARRVLRFEADYGVAAEVVWDALVDPVLVEGWLGELAIEAAPEGEYSLRWPDAPPPHGRVAAGRLVAWPGTILVIAPPKGRTPAVLELDFPALDFPELDFPEVDVLGVDVPGQAISGHVGIRFELSRVPSGGGHDGTHLLLEYTAFLEAAEVAPLEDFWRRRVRYLADLLRGRPREWNRAVQLSIGIADGG